jgi:hypothetical protein
MRRAALAAAAAALLVAAASCGDNSDATIDGVLLAQADGVSEPPEGMNLAVDVDTIEKAVVPAGAKVVRLAIGRKVHWNQVQALASRVQAAGARPVYLVGNWNKTRAFAIEDTWPGGNRAIQIIDYVDGKACIQPPGSVEAKCVQSSTKNYIEEAYVREFVREQVKMFDLPLVEVDLPASLAWADVVRTIDGARTCCQGITVRVRLKPPAPAAE